MTTFFDSKHLVVVALLLPTIAGADPINDQMKGSKTPWTWSCDGLDGDLKQHRSFCRGHVIATRDDIKIVCDTMQIDQDEKLASKKMTCMGNVDLRSKSGRATSEKAEFDNESEWLTLTGKPILYTDTSEERGEVITYNRKTEQYAIHRLHARFDSSEASSQPASRPASQPSKSKSAKSK